MSNERSITSAINLVVEMLESKEAKSLAGHDKLCEVYRLLTGKDAPPGLAERRVKANITRLKDPPAPPSNPRYGTRPPGSGRSR